MSGQQIGTVIGGAIGAYFGAGSPAAIQLGMAIGGAIGGAVDPTHINGPKIGDGQQQAATDGNPIAWVQGAAMVAGTIVQVSSRRQIRHKDNGKGSGTVAVTFTAVQDFAILICESCESRGSTMSAVLMVLQDGKLVYDVRPGSTMLADSYKWKANVDFLYGGEGQLPHPTLEAITGVGNTPAYRGSMVAVFKNFDVSAAGDRIPSFQFVVSSQAIVAPMTKLVSATNGPAGPEFEVKVPRGVSVGDLLVMFATYSITYGTGPSMCPDGWTHLGGDNAGNTGRYDFMYRIADGSESGQRITLIQPLTFGHYGPWSAAVYCVAAGSYEGMPTGRYQRDNINSPQMTITGGGGSLFILYEAGHPTSVFEGWPSSDNQVDNSGYGTHNYTCTQTVAGVVSAWTRSYIATASQADMQVGIPRHLTPQPPSADTTLQSIATAICRRGGLALADIDTTALSAITVAGYPIARQANAADCLLPLLQAYFGYASEYDAQLHFKFYGTDADVVIDRADLIEGNDANNGAIVSNLRNQSTEFPRRVVGSYMDPAQNYTVADVAAERRAIDVTAIGDQSFQIPVVMAAGDAAKAVDKALKVAYATLEGTLEYSVPFADADVYLSLAAGEPLQFQGKRYVLDEMMIGNGSLKLTTRYDRQSAYTSNVQPILGNAPVPPASPYSGPTTLIPMNLPAQRPQDSVGVYIAAAGALGQTSWAGCTVQVSYDGTATWQNALTITMESEIGTVALAEPTGGEPLTVDMVRYDLVNATPAQLAAQANAFAVTDATGNVTQLGQFATATETMTDRQFQLTSVSRSLGGTAATPVAVGNPFTLMDAAYFLPIDPSFAGRTLYFRGVGFGEAAEDAAVYPLVYTALARADSAPFITEDGLYQFTTESGTLALSTE